MWVLVEQLMLKMQYRNDPKFSDRRGQTVQTHQSLHGVEFQEQLGGFAQ